MQMKLPRIKQVHNPELLSGNRIRIGSIHYGVGSEICDDEEGTIWQLLQLIDGTRSIDKIIEDLQKVRPELDRQSIHQAINTIISAGFAEDDGSAPPDELTPVDLERYSRSANYFGWIDTQPRSSRYEIQSRLKTTRVTILGLGGIGSTIAMSLAAVGVGSIHCVDFDKIEMSNLNRQLLYTEDDIGVSKVEQAVERLRRINPHIEITGEELEVKSSYAVASLMKKCDLFILCADKPADLIDSWTNEAALSTGTPWLSSHYAGPMSVVGIYVPYQTPCYQCVKQDEKQRRHQIDGGEGKTLLMKPGVNAVIAPTANLAGHLAALEAIYFLADLEPQTVGRIFHQNLIRYDHCYYIQPSFWAECPACRISKLHHQ